MTGSHEPHFDNKAAHELDATEEAQAAKAAEAKAAAAKKLKDANLFWGGLAFAVAVVVLAPTGFVAHDIGLGVNGQPNKAIAVVLFGPLVLSMVGGIFRVIAHYMPEKTWAKPMDGSGKIVALYAASFVVIAGLIQIANWSEAGSV